MNNTILSDFKKHKLNFKTNNEGENEYYLKVMDLLVSSTIPNKKKKKKKIHNYFNSTTGFYHDDELLKEYNFRVHGDTKGRKVTYIKKEKNCSSCGGQLFHDNENCHIVCTSCGLCKKNVVYDSTIDTEFNYIKYDRTYQKSNHFSNCLKKCKRLPEFHKNKIEEQFKEIEYPLHQIYKANGKEFLNYKFIIRKLLILNNLKQFLKFYPVLKSNQKVRVHDRLWFQLCEQLEMKYIATL